MANTKGYVQLRRGILDHLAVFTMAETKVYIALLCLANHDTGKANVSMVDLAEATGYSRRHIQDAVKRLEILRYIKVKRSNNRWHDTQFIITKYDNSSKKCTSEVTSDIGSCIGSDVQSQYQQKDPPENLENKENKDIVLFDELFWPSYPRKEAKKKAREAWGKLKPTKELAEQIVKAVEATKRSGKWSETRFVPLPATYLNGERWLDEIGNNGHRPISREVLR